MEKDLAIVLPGRSMIGTSPRFVNSRVIIPRKRGCIPIAVATIKPRRPQDDLPTTYPPKSLGILMNSNEHPKVN